MPTAAELSIVIDGKLHPSVGKSFDDAKDKANGLGGTLKRVSEIAAGFVLGQGLLKLGGLLAGTISNASDLNESMSKSATVFGDVNDRVMEFASGAAKGIGMSRQSAIEATATFGNFLSAMGAGKDQAADMSIGMVKLAADLASFNNANPEEVLLALRSGLSGEAEPMRRFGVALSETAVKSKAAQLGLKGVGGELTEQEKIQARYAIIMEQTTTAQGDFARTSDGLANRQRILKAEFSDLQANIGSALLPVFVSLAGVLVEKVLPAVGQLSDFIGPKISGAIAAAQLALAPLIAQLGPLYERLSQNKEVVATVAAVLAGVLAGAVAAITVALGGMVVGVLAAAAPFIALGIALGLAGVALSKLGINFEDVRATIAKAVTFVTNTVMPALQSAFQSAVAAVRKQIDFLTGYFQSDLLPAFQNIQTAVKAVVTFFQQNWPMIEKVVRPIVDSVVTEIEAISKIVLKVVGIIVDLIGGDFSGAWQKAKDIVHIAIDAIARELGNLDDLIRALIPLVLAAAKALGQAVLDGLKAGLTAAGGIALDIANAVTSAIKNLINTQVIDKLNRALEFEFDSGIPKAPKVKINPPDIPHLQSGLPYVPADMLAFLHKGEAVLPSGQAAAYRTGGGITVNFNGPVYGIDDFKRVIVETVADTKRRGGFNGIF